MERRNLLVAISSLSAVSGCLTSDSTVQTPTETETGTPTDENTETPQEPTPTETETPAETETETQTEEISRTEVGGVIDSDTTWTDSDYLITDTVQIAENATLTIEPEVSVVAGELDGDSLFLVNGEISAVGTAENPIRFNGQDSYSTFFDAEGSTPETFVELDNCVIENGGPL